MSRYNEEEWQRIKDAERERQKRKYQNKYINDTYKRLQNDNAEHENRGFIDNTYKKPELYNDIKEIKIKDDTIPNIIIISTICFTFILGAGFLFSGLYTNFFYEKGKDDLIVATKKIDNITNSVKSNMQSYIPRKQEPIKKWKRTIWEERKGHVCNKGKCTYSIKQSWSDCYRSTGKCNPTQSRTLNRNNDRLKESRTYYL